MKLAYRKIISFVLTIMTNILSFFFLMQLFTLVKTTMLQAGYNEGGGVSQFIRVFTGIPLFLILGIAWMGFFIYTFYYYEKGAEKRNLIKRFLFITGWEILVIPIIVIIYQLFLPIPTRAIDFVLIAVPFIGGLISIYASKNFDIDF
ncbi:hypothetical protein C8C77_13210 [Halanaerobium saccharolyticum]|uniref:DUF5671 domain-containing protein n=1 Tax=Halanaerobium saccharolyticum TaxID=43595 RepID=A0A4R7YPR3_9FIRM|nr:hypothetical protein [Halanaerobium saccharolyticum]RAK05177.1 hypothetical protein C7958_12910 [Halanaerobium saccharolyticum]TDV99008.1 hypothetical protein C8C77_13210 [Halanaerobium saccharolyticum]TDX51699.1 hypothetical protein C7956_13110 [Halanaerobium saccharolyticum]